MQPGSFLNYFIEYFAVILASPTSTSLAIFSRMASILNMCLHHLEQVAPWHSPTLSSPRILYAKKSDAEGTEAQLCNSRTLHDVLKPPTIITPLRNF